MHPGQLESCTFNLENLYFYAGIISYLINISSLCNQNLSLLLRFLLLLAAVEGISTMSPKLDVAIPVSPESVGVGCTLKPFPFDESSVISPESGVGVPPESVVDIPS